MSSLPRIKFKGPQKGSLKPMPVETYRQRHSLKIPVPDQDELAFYIWVNDAITFKRTDGIGQEIRLTMRNWDGPTPRSVVIADVDTGEGSEPLKIERILSSTQKDENGIGQEARWTFFSDPELHERSHEVTINARKEDGEEDENYTLTIKKVDVIYVKNENGIGQEAYWTLNNQDDEDQINFSAPDAVYNDKAGPIRLDWFQTITEAKIGGWDFLIVKYAWDTDADLDIRHNQISPVGGTMGYDKDNTVSDFIFWGGDNVGSEQPCAETVYYDLKAARKHKGDLVMGLRAYWYSPHKPGLDSPVISPVTLSLTLSKGGSVVLNARTWEPSGEKKKKTEILATKSVDTYRDEYGSSDTSTWPGQLLGTLSVSPTTGKWKFF
jgi:hypothetical protein